MKSRLLTISILVGSICSILLLLFALAVPTRSLESSFNSRLGTNNIPVLRVNLGGEPSTLDPTLASDSISIMPIEQLFIGLVDLDDETGAVVPELATNWTVSPDGKVYTFNLRNDVNWSDGNLVTAQDVYDGILRALNPANGANYAYILYDIENAQDYNSGIITDPNQVGINVINNTTLQIALEVPATHFLSALAMSVARPVPQWAIDAFGDNWTEPGNIVTNGPYRLVEWVHNEHVLLEKNPNYYNAQAVQIEQVNMAMISDSNTASQMYLDDQLDTVDVALNILNSIENQELYTAPLACTYFYGFNISQPPFDNPLVRRAFAAATNRQLLASGVLNYLQRPALTFTPRGVFGYVDGYTDNIGIPYNPTQAQQLLVDAGYPNGQGLPPISIAFNTSQSHQWIAEIIQSSWFDTLGVSVTLESLPWSDYLNQLNNGQLQVFRGGWCADYADAYNFLGEGLWNRAPYGNWSNPTYDALLNQTTQEQNAVIRQELFMQAEEILVESDVVMLPLYHYARPVAAKPYLERTYSVFAPDIAAWRITKSSTTIGVSGGSLTSYDGNTTIIIPAAAITDTVVMTHTPEYDRPAGENLTGVGNTFDLTVVYSDTRQPAQLVPSSTYTISIDYMDAELAGAIEDTLALYYWDGGQWSMELSSVVDIKQNTITATPNHFSLWTVMGETNKIFLPLVQR